EHVVRFPNILGNIVEAIGTESLGQGLAALTQFFFLDAAREFVATALEGLVDGFWAGGETTLQCRECEAHRALALTIELVGTIHFFLYIVSDSGVESSLKIRE